MSAADLAAYPSIWFLKKWGASEVQRWLNVEPLPPWVTRVAALGYGQPTEITGEETLDIARSSMPIASGLPTKGDPTGLRQGSMVTVTPDDVGRDPVEGVLVGADGREVVIRRMDPRAGTVHVHFPRAGYDVALAGG